MPRSSARLLCALVATAMLLTIVPLGVVGDDETPVRVIVVFKDKVDEGLVKDVGGKILTKYTLIPSVVTKLKAKNIETLKKNSQVISVEEDATVTIQGDLDGKAKPTRPEPTLPDGEIQWGVDRIDADLAWETSTGSGINVAILDTGIDTDHPELEDIYKGGIDIINDDDDPEDDNGHGTHCAGIVAAAYNEDNEDDEGVVGVAYGVNLYAVKVLDSRGSGSYSQIVSGIQWCIATHSDQDDSNDIHVISMSLSGSSDSTGLKAACDAAQSAGVIIVAAAGNSGKKNANLDTIQYPAKYESVIAVGAIDSKDTRPSFSSTGSTLDLVAPGVSVWSTYLDGSYKALSGTSMACPHVAGTVALILATTPSGEDWTWDEIYGILTGTADDLGAPGFDNAYGFGLVDAEEAVTGSETPPPP